MGWGADYLSSRTSDRGQMPQFHCKPAPPQHLSFPCPYSQPAAPLSLVGFFPSLWDLAGPAEGCVGGNHKQNRQEDVQGVPARDAWRSMRGLCPRQRPLLLSVRDRLSPGPVPVSCPLKEGKSLLPQQKSFLFHSPVLKPDLDLLVTKIQAV